MSEEKLIGWGYVFEAVNYNEEVLTEEPSSQIEFEDKALTTKRRKGLKESQFAIPEKRKYPIDTKARARNALARVSQNGTPEEKRKVRSAVKKKYPDIKQSSKGKKKSRK